jgi:lipopolysaccharide transport system ATP-binding protein
MDFAIKAENLSKAYMLGEIGTGTISRDLERWIAKLRGKEDPFMMIEPGKNSDSTPVKNDVLWSLRDVSFEIAQGDAVGIIGRNGAGKSTLLKVLSKVTSPTTGRLLGSGRIASLLEVGTGFHPELTGRENIYLNGAILGMRKKEITRKFDEIVEFAGVGRFIDTPVKRYSSGMYVRLAFAVAAHLESEILIVDEVLAVGDAEFQKKCLGKMGEVSQGGGRTVLFVSHNMEAILKLCNKSMFLAKGKMIEYGDTHTVIDTYMQSDVKQDKILNLRNVKREYTLVGNKAKLLSVRLLSANEHEYWKVSYGKEIEFRIELEVLDNFKFLELGIAIYTNTDFEFISSLTSDAKIIESHGPGMVTIDYKFCDLNLLPGIYKVSFGVRSENNLEDITPNICSFEVTVSESSVSAKTSTRHGLLAPNIEFNVAEFARQADRLPTGL